MITLYSIICLLFTGLYLAIIAYLIKGWAALKRPVAASDNFKTKVTILIAARDEEKNIRATIEDLLAQEYPKHLTEIIIVDDHSTDSTPGIIRSYAGMGVTLFQLQTDEILNSYKKKAIAEAITRSHGDLMVATDADCRMGPKWLSTIVGYFESGDKLMISSPVTYFQEKTLFEHMQTLEFSFLIGIGASFIGNRRASTCNGANLAYRKDTFYEVGGFKGIDDLASGDDELLLQKVAERFPGKIGFLKHRDAIVYTHAKHNLKSFIQQRRRWASKSTKYKDKKIIALAVCFWVFNAMLVANGALSFFSRDMLNLFLVQIGLKYLFEIVFLIPVMTFLKRPGLVWLISIVAPLHILYVVYIGIRGNTGKYAWKGRMVK
ncbi:glycosyltransferase [Mucilaginibacter mali]|uniref:Glycosyltransferase n=1 Tax=Mucilaginibacter mali TaxID=2740462 RepID=A0A7D4QNT5_9SPHI|nr:glycosyltransferase [Mucilaginibacter mali]QKJ32730.1 glycosyltransferase [Mucilaginibacter mali]